MRISINGHKFVVKTMITSKDKSNGMMNKTFTSNNQGMLFLMDKDDHYFWMKNCVIPLDIIFIDENTITKIHHNCKPCKGNDCPNYSGYGDMILEINGGVCKELKIKEGDQINF
jgi:uncharacterized membrane protein (UPF0127 family)